MAGNANYGRILRRSTLNCMFARPVYVQRNCQYKITVAVHSDGYYSGGRASNSVICKGVQFNFGPPFKDSKNPCPDEFGALLRGLIFSF